MSWKLFLGLGLMALAFGIGAAKVQKRLTADSGSPNVEQPASVPGAQMPEDLAETRELVHRMAESLLRPRDEISAEIRKDCEFRHSREHRMIERCVGDRLTDFDQMRSILSTQPHEMSRIAITLCMDERRSLNGFDWQSVKWCDERSIIGLQRG